MENSLSLEKKLGKLNVIFINHPDPKINAKPVFGSDKHNAVPVRKLSDHFQQVSV